MKSRHFAIPDLERFPQMVYLIASALLEAPPVKTATWQSQDITDRPEMTSYELMHARVELPIPEFQPQLAICTGANMPWAEDHFQERVSGEPLNPPPSEQWWPYAVQGNASHKDGQKFSHTYPERFWPRFAGLPTSQNQLHAADFHPAAARRGVRYEYGDLYDVLSLLKKDLYTRQAYLPVWFPEDTGAVEGQRVPCTLGYHFLFREKLHMEYHIRSCDFMRHWRDDVYMAGRLMQWMGSALGVEPGTLTMNIGSFHIFQGDRGPLRAAMVKMRQQVERNYYGKIASAL